MQEAFVPGEELFDMQANSKTVKSPAQFVCRKSVVSIGSATIVIALLGAVASPTFAQEPIAILSIAGQDRFAEDLDYLARLSGAPGFERQVINWLGELSNIRALDGVDPARPLGAVIATDSLVVTPIAFFPVRDADRLLDSLAGAIGGARQVSGRVDLWTFGQGDAVAYARVDNGWLYFAENRAALDKLPDPAHVLGDLPEKYDAALRLNLQRIPDVFRQFLIDLVRQILIEDTQRAEGESAAAHKLRGTWLDFEFDLFERMISESETVTFGYQIDPATRSGAVDVQFRPMAETALSAALDHLREAETRFHVLTSNQANQDAVVMAHATLSMGQTEIERATAQLGELREPALAFIAATEMIQSDVDRELLTKLAETMIDTTDATIRSGRLDMAILGEGGTSAITVLAAAHVGSSENLNDLLARIADVTGDDDRVRLRLDAARIDLSDAPDEDPDHPQSIRVDAVEFATENAGALERLFGETPRLYLAIGQDTLGQGALWMGIGPGAVEGLERIARSEHAAVDNVEASEPLAAGGKRAPPVSFQLQLGEIAAVAAEASDNFLWRFWMGGVARSLRSSGDDHLAFELSATEQELHARLEAGEGVLRAVAATISLRLANAGAAAESSQ